MKEAVDNAHERRQKKLADDFEEDLAEVANRRAGQGRSFHSYRLIFKSLNLTDKKLNRAAAGNISGQCRPPF